MQFTILASELNLDSDVNRCFFAIPNNCSQNANCKYPSPKTTAGDTFFNQHCDLTSKRSH